MSARDPRLEAQARHCAEAAAEASAALLGARRGSGPARAWSVEQGFPCEALRAGDEPFAVLSARLDGGPRASAALLLPQGVLERVLAALVGEPGVKLLDERARSALRELGNIAISAAANALSERVRESVLPSVPGLLLDQSADACTRQLGSARAWLIEMPLVRDSEPLRLLFLWVR